MSELQQKPIVGAGDFIRALRSSNGIPALDENVMQLCRLSGRSDTAAADLTAVIMRDAALTSRLLSMANSVAYRPRMPVKTVSSAVVLFGFDRIQQLAVGLSLFRKHAADVRDKELYRLLVCAYYTGSLAMHMARCTKHDTPEERFVAGLLWQIPRLVLANAQPEQYQRMEEMVRSGEADTEDACREVFGLGFSEVADAVAEYWHLRGGGRAVTSEKGMRQVRCAAMLADMLFGNRPGGEKAMEQALSNVARELGRDQVSLPDFVGDAARQDPNIGEFFQLSEQDIVMMARIAEWGKVSPSAVADGLMGGYEKRPELKLADDEPLMMVHFLSELTLAVHNRYSFNDVLLMAMEGVFRCMDVHLVLAAFIDGKQNRLTGRLCLSHGAHINAMRYAVSLDEAELGAARCVRELEPVAARVGDAPILPHEQLFSNVRSLGFCWFRLWLGERRSGNCASRAERSSLRLSPMTSCGPAPWPGTSACRLSNSHDGGYCKTPPRQRLARMLALQFRGRGLFWWRASVLASRTQVLQEILLSNEPGVGVNATTMHKPFSKSRAAGIKKERIAKALEFVTANRISTIPSMLARINKLARDPDASAVAYSRLCEMDQSSCVKVLLLANSAAYGAPSGNVIRTVEQAVIRIGIRRVREVLTSTVVSPLFKRGQAFCDYSPTALWLNSVGVAVSNRLLYDLTGRKEPEDADPYLAGLLHNFALPIEHLCFHDDGFEAAVDARFENQSVLADEERRYLGIDHNELGAALADSWHFPKAIIAVIRHHDEHQLADDVADDELLHVTRASQWLCRELKFGYAEFPELCAEEYLGSFNALGIDADLYATAIERLGLEMRRLQGLGWFSGLRLSSNIG